MDVVILLDSTDSIASNYTEEKQNFTIGLISGILAVKPNAKIGLFAFGDRTYPEFYMNSLSSFSMLSRAVKNMWHTSGNEDLATAILYTVVNGFQKITGDRDCVPNYLVIVTYNPIGDLDTAEMLHRVLHFKGVQVVVLNMADVNSNIDMNKTLISNQTEYFNLTSIFVDIEMNNASLDNETEAETGYNYTNNNDMFFSVNDSFPELSSNQSDLSNQTNPVSYNSQTDVNYTLSVNESIAEQFPNLTEVSNMTSMDNESITDIDINSTNANESLSFNESLFDLLSTPFSAEQEFTVLASDKTFVVTIFDYLELASYVDFAADFIQSG